MIKCVVNDKIWRAASIVTLLTLIFVGCGGDPGAFQTNNHGLEYRFVEKSDNPRAAQYDDLLLLDAKYSTENGTVLFDSKKNPREMIMPLDSSGYPGDIMEALSMTNIGDSLEFYLLADSFYGNTLHMPLPDSIVPGSKLFFQIRVNKIQTKDQQRAEELEKQQQDRERAAGRLGDYLNQKGISNAPEPSGLIYIEKAKGTGEQVKAGMLVKVDYKGMLLNGEVFDSSMGRAPMTFVVGAGEVISGMDEGITRMRVGGKAELIIPPDLAYKENASPSGKIEPWSNLVFDVEVLSAKSPEEVLKEAQEMEPERIKEFVKKNNITEKPRPSGVYYIEMKAGTGAYPEGGQQVYVHYTGRLLNGRVFDSSYDRGKPINFKLGTGQVIPGWDEGIALMRKGGIAHLIIPSAMAYGPRRSGPIGPYEPLFFEVELVDIK